jgi:hypothetical protein
MVRRSVIKPLAAGPIAVAMPACEVTPERRRGSRRPNLTSQWAEKFSSADAPASVGSVVDILGELAEDDVEWLLTAGLSKFKADLAMNAQVGLSTVPAAPMAQMRA